MIQVGLFMAIYATGIAWWFALGSRRDPLIGCAFAFVIGLALVAGLQLALLRLGLPITHSSLIAIWLGTLALLIARGVRRGAPDAGSARVILIWTLLFAAVTAALASTNRAHFDTATHHLLATARLLDNTDGDLARLWAEVPPAGLLMALACSLAGLVDLAYPYALAPVLATSLIAALVVVTWRAARSRGAPRRGALVLVAGAGGILLTTYSFAFHAFSPQIELPSTFFLLGFVGLSWLASEGGDGDLLSSALVCLAAFALSSPSGGAGVVPFFAIALWTIRLPRSEVAPTFAVFAAMLPWALAEVPTFQDRRAALLLVPATFVVWLVASARTWPDRWRHGATVTAGVVVAGGCAIAMVRARGALTTLADAAMSSPLSTAASGWGLLWIGVGLLGLLAFRLPRRPSGGWFLVALAAETAIALAIGGSHAWRPLSLRTLILVLFYLVVRYAAIFTGPGAPLATSTVRQRILEPFGGHRRLLALTFVGVLLATLVDNVRVHRANLVNHPPVLKLLRHDGFTLERAITGQGGAMPVEPE